MKTSALIVLASIAATVSAQAGCDDCPTLGSLQKCSPAWRAAYGACAGAPCNYNYGSNLLADCEGWGAANPPPTFGAATTSAGNAGATPVLTPAPAATVTSGIPNTDPLSSIASVVSSAGAAASSAAGEISSSAGSVISSAAGAASSIIASASSAITNGTISANGTASSGAVVATITSGGSTFLSTSTKATSQTTKPSPTSSGPATGSSAAVSPTGNAAGNVKPAAGILALGVLIAGYAL